MTDDAALSRELTTTIRAIEGVAGVFPAQPRVEAAAAAVAVTLALRAPDALVDIERADGITTVSAHISTLAEVPAPVTVRRVAEFLRARLQTGGAPAGDLVINVKVRLVEGGGRLRG